MPKITHLALAGTMSVFDLFRCLCHHRFWRGQLWLTNFQAARAKAKAEKKLLLVSFIGSDWCVFSKS